MKRFIGFVVIALVFVLAGCTPPNTPGSLVVYNNLVYNTIAVGMDGVYQGSIDPRHSGTITSISVGTHSFTAVTTTPNAGYSITTSINFASGDAKTWTIYNEPGSTLNIAPISETK
jgi:hypothetical protein